jgi:hypothetical protein
MKAKKIMIMLMLKYEHKALYNEIGHYLFAPPPTSFS